jgi:SAM-dependent methyltransferase
VTVRRDPDFAAVDAGDAGDLVAMMDAASAWPAVRTLRAWERERLALRPGERLIDVGCGPGDAALALGAALGPAGEVVGVDSSEAMVGAARERAAPDGSCDAARAERTLQWVPDPAGVVAELHRVLRPGGRLALIDTDWSTLVVETGDDAVAAAVRAHVGVERRRPSHVGRHLWGLAHAAGFVDVEATAATHVATGWDPDRTPAPAGFPPMAGLADDMVTSGDLDERGEPGFVAAVEDAARAQRLVVAVTMYSIAGRRP